MTREKPIKRLKKQKQTRLDAKLAKCIHAKEQKGINNLKSKKHQKEFIKDNQETSFLASAFMDCQKRLSSRLEQRG